MADALRVPVSNVVRTVLEDALEAVEMFDQSELELEFRRNAQWARRWRERYSRRWRERSKDEPQQAAGPDDDSAPSPAEDDLSVDDVMDGILGYQALVLARDTECAGCGVHMVRGEGGHLGIRDEPGPRVIICDACLPTLG